MHRSRHRLSVLAALVIALALTATARADPLEDAVAADARGDYASALRIFRSLADDGDRDAQFRLGSMYENGRGVASDQAEAARWYRKAADQGHAPAEFNLAYMCATGRGVARDAAEAKRLFELVASNPSAPAELRSLAGKHLARIEASTSATSAASSAVPSSLGTLGKRGPGASPNPPPPPPPALDAGFARSPRPETASTAMTGTRGPVAPIVLPEFPWPPPEPSSQVVLPDGLFRVAGKPTPSLSSVGNNLAGALQQARYFEYSYYRAPNGFALVARLERIASDGAPMPEQSRFLMPGTEEPFSLGVYVKQLFFAPEGYYRQITFVVTDRPFTATGERLDARAAAQLLSGGANRLSRDYDTTPFTANHSVSALVYEFRKGARDGDVSTLTPGRLGARMHLDRAGIYPALAARR